MYLFVLLNCILDSARQVQFKQKDNTQKNHNTPVTLHAWTKHVMENKRGHTTNMPDP